MLGYRGSTWNRNFAGPIEPDHGDRSYHDQNQARELRHGKSSDEPVVFCTQEFYEEDQQLLETELFAKIPKETAARYLDRGRPARDMSPEEKAKREKGYANVQRFIREFSEQGGLLLAATDMGNSRMPGIAIHREMQLFVDAGVASYKALLGATRYPAEMMKKADLIGTLEEGKQADILVLGSNPADDIAASKDLRYVIRKGKIVRAP